MEVCQKAEEQTPSFEGDAACTRFWTRVVFRKNVLCCSYTCTDLNASARAVGRIYLLTFCLLSAVVLLGAMLIVI